MSAAASRASPSSTPGIRIRPPFLAAAWVAIAFALDLAWPAARWLPAGWSFLGCVPIAAGVGLASWALGLFRCRGTTHHPFRDPEALVTAGPYRFTRNPMYLGVLSVLLGVALLSGSPWLLLPPVAFGLWIDRLQIPREEAALARLFGASFEAYRARVRRWI